MGDHLWFTFSVNVDKLRGSPYVSRTPTNKDEHPLLAWGCRQEEWAGGISSSSSSSSVAVSASATLRCVAVVDLQATPCLLACLQEE
ncbi:hypothetical protein BHE74_00001796 [Ensete ventricosum]|nr:hypothetical protein BHE74_00001796 [Ensete ventricosum]